MLALLAVADVWSAITVVIGVALGSRNSDPVVYWISLSLIAAILLGLLLVTRRVWRRAPSNGLSDSV